LLDDERRFDKHVRHNDIPVLALFRAAWSGDSSALHSSFEEAAPQLEPNARLATVDGPALPDLAGRLKVVRYPTLLLLHRPGPSSRLS
jgi:thioredoxin 2